MDLNQPDCGLEWEERMEEQLEERLEEPSFVSDGGGYLYSLAGGDTGVARFSVMIGVWGQADELQYESISLTSSPLSLSNISRQARRGACCVALGSAVYVMGGMTASKTVSNSVEIYRNTLFASGQRLEVNGNVGSPGDPRVPGAATQQPAEMLVARSGGEAVAGPGHNTIYVMGGRTDNNNNYTNSMEVYHVDTDTWTILPGMMFGRREFRCACIEDRILVVGGYIEDVATDRVEMFNISTNSWTEISHLPSPAADFALAKVEKTDLSVEMIQKYFQFSEDVVVEKTKRTKKPISEHFNWKH